MCDDQRASPFGCSRMCGYACVRTMYVWAPRASQVSDEGKHDSTNRVLEESVEVVAEQVRVCVCVDA